MTEPIYYINGGFFPASKAFIHISDLAIMRGYGVFDFLITYHHKPFLLKEHLKRLKNSVAQIDLKLPKTLTEIEKLVLKTLAKNKSSQEKAIRIIVTGGESLAPDFVKPKGQGSLIITVDPIHKYLPEFYKHGVKVVTYNHCRPIPKAKSLNYTIAIKAQKYARQNSAIEAIYNCDGFLTEGTTSNFFAVIDGKVVTTNQGILHGITRKVVISLVTKIAPLQERPISQDEVKNFSEAFITASNKEIMPVAQIDNFRIGKGKEVKPGPITQKIMQAFADFTRKT